MPEPVKEKKGDPGPKVYSVNLEEASAETKKMVVKVLSNYIPKEEFQNVENK